MQQNWSVVLSNLQQQQQITFYLWVYTLKGLCKKAHIKNKARIRVTSPDCVLFCLTLANEFGFREKQFKRRYRFTPLS